MWLWCSTGKTYRVRVSNVGISTSLNFRIQNHNLLLAESEGSYTVQQNYSSLDIHVGQSYSFLVTMDQNASSDYYIVASARFVNETIWQRVTGVAVLHYTNSKGKASGPLPEGPQDQFDKTYSMNQARSIRYACSSSCTMQSLVCWASLIQYNNRALLTGRCALGLCRWNVSASGARPNPQGSFRYGSINVTEVYVLKNKPPVTIDGKRRTTLSGISYVNPATPIRLADQYKLKGVYKLDFPTRPLTGPPRMETSIINGTYKGFIEVILQNNETKVHTYHMSGYAFFVVGFVQLPSFYSSRHILYLKLAYVWLCWFNLSWLFNCSMDYGEWTENSRGTYNKWDGIARTTAQVHTLWHIYIYDMQWKSILIIASIIFTNCKRDEPPVLSP